MIRVKRDCRVKCLIEFSHFTFTYFAFIVLDTKLVVKVSNIQLSFYLYATQLFILFKYI